MSTVLKKARVYNSDRLKARHETILKVVREEIAANGFEGVTMHALAEKAGVVKKTLYNIYGGKDQLLLAAVGELVGEYRETPDQVDAGVPAIVESRRIATQTVATNPRYATAMLQSLIRVPSDHALVDVLLRQGISFSEHHLRIESARGHLAPGVNHTRLARGIVAQGFGVITLLSKGLIDATEVPETSLRGMLAMLQGDALGDLSTWITSTIEELDSGTDTRLTAVGD